MLLYSSIQIQMWIMSENENDLISKEILKYYGNSVKQLKYDRIRSIASILQVIKGSYLSTLIRIVTRSFVF